MNRSACFAVGLAMIGLIALASQAEEAAPASGDAPAAPAEQPEFPLQVHPPNLPDFDPVSVSSRFAADQLQDIFSMVDTGNQQFANRNYFAAVHAYKTAEAVDPGNLTLLKPLGRACVEAEFHDQAVPALEPVHAANPEDAVTNAALVRAYLGLLDIAMFDNEFESAEALLAKILAIEPGQEKAKALVNEDKTLSMTAKVDALRSTAAALREKRRNPIAATRLERLLELAPQDYDALVQLADTYGALRLFDKAEETYLKAVAIKQSPDEDRKRLDAYLWGQAQYARDLKEYPKAIVALEKLRAAHPEDTKTLVELAKAFLGADNGRPDNAVPTIQKAKELAPNSAQVAIALAEVYKASEQMGQALASLAEAAPAADDPGLTFNTLGMYQAEIAVEAVADKSIVDKATAEKSDAEKIAAEKAAIAVAAAEKVASANAEAEKLMAEKAAAEQMVAVKSDAVVAATQSMESGKAAVETATSEKAAAEQALSEKMQLMNAADEAVKLAQADFDKLAAGSAGAEQMMMMSSTSAATAAGQKLEAAKAAFESATAEKAAAEALVTQKSDASTKANEQLASMMASSESAASEKTPAEQQLAQMTEAANKANEIVATLSAELDKANAEKVQAEQVLAQKVEALPAAIASTASAKKAAEKAAAEKALIDALAQARSEADAAQTRKAETEQAAAPMVEAASSAAAQAAAKEAEASAAAAAKSEADATVAAMAQALQSATDALAAGTAEAQAASTALAEAQATATQLAEAAKAVTENCAAVETAEQAKLAEQRAVSMSGAAPTEAEKAVADAIAAAKSAMDQAVAAKTEAETRATDVAAAMKAAEEKVAAAKQRQDEAAASKGQAEQAAAEKAAAAQSAMEQAAAMKSQSDQAAMAAAEAQKTAADSAAALDAAVAAIATKEKDIERSGALKIAAEQAAAPESIAARAAESAGAAYSAYKSSGLAYVAAKQWGPALASFGEGIKHNAAGDTEFFHNYGYAYYNMPNRNRGALDESVKFLAKATELDQSHLPSFSLLGDVYTSINDPIWIRKGAQALEKAAALSPEDASLFYRLGNVYAREKRTVKAYAAFARAVELAPDNQEYLRQYMQAHVDDGRFEKALSLVSGRDLAALSVPVHIVRGRALAGLGRWDEVRPLCAEMTAKTEDKALRDQIGLLDAQAGAALAARVRVGGEKLVLILFGEGIESDRTWRDPERDAIPHLWNDLAPLGELREAVSLEDRYLPEEIASGLMTGQWPAVAESSLTYYQHVRPTLMRLCADCHNKDKAKGEFVVDDPAAMLQGGEKHAANVIVPGKGKDSYLVQCIAASEMPPKKPIKNPRVTDLLTRWIDQGANVGEPVPSGSLDVPTLLERYRATRAAAPEKVWAVIGSEIYKPLRASASPAFGEQAAPAFVSVPDLRDAVDRMRAILSDTGKQNLERPARLARIAEQTPEGLGIALGNDAANQLVANIVKRADLVDRADDRLVYAIARAVIDTHKPDVLFVALSQPRAGSTPEDVCRADAAVYGIWNALNQIPEYRNNTNFVVVTPVPQENTAYVLRIGPRIRAGAIDRGQNLVWNRPVVLTDLMVSLADMLDIDYEVPEANLKPN